MYHICTNKAALLISHYQLLVHALILRHAYIHIESIDEANNLDRNTDSIIPRLPQEWYQS